MYINFLTAEIGIRQKILGQEAMRLHLGNRPTGNVGAIEEAGTHCPIPWARNTSKFQNTIFVWMFQISTQQKIIKKIILNAYHFITDYILRELIFIRHVTDTNLPKRKFMANYNKKSCKTKNLNFSWAQI